MCHKQRPNNSGRIFNGVKVKNKKTISKFTFARLVLCGCVAGVALAGIIAPLLGLGDGTTRDVTGAIAGGGLSALLFKAVHLV